MWNQQKRYGTPTLIKIQLTVYGTSRPCGVEKTQKLLESRNKKKKEKNENENENKNQKRKKKKKKKRK